MELGGGRTPSLGPAHVGAQWWRSALPRPAGGAAPSSVLRQAVALQAPRFGIAPSAFTPTCQEQFLRDLS